MSLVSKEVALSSLCQDQDSDREDRLMVIEQQVPHAELARLCSVAGGRLPGPEEAADVSARFREAVSDLAACSDEELDWELPLPLAAGGGPPSPRQTCPHFSPAANSTVGHDCALPRCGACLVPAGTTYTLKGLCAVSLSSRAFDTEFYPFGSLGGRPYFRGLANSHLYFDPASDSWRLQSLRYPGEYLLHPSSDSATAAVTAALPLKSGHWLVADGNSDSDVATCTQGSAHRPRLAFSICRRGQFTCSNGECIDLE